MLDALDTSHLTEEALGDFLRARFDPAVVADKCIPGATHRFRPDYRSDRHRTIVEFDGDSHYCSARRVLADMRRDKLLCEAGYVVIRIPYFVQLTQEVIEDLFGAAIEDTSDFRCFPHGFISNTVVFPADFCELGLARFEADLMRFSYIKADILASLKRAMLKRDAYEVYPPSKLAAWATLAAPAPASVG
jgi:hypothetical protein